MEQTVWLWIAVAIVFAIIEVLTFSFGFMFASLGALVAAAVASTGQSWQLSTVAFTVMTGLSFWLLRPWVMSRFQTSTQMKSRLEELIGKQGSVIEIVDPRAKTYRVLVGGEDWSASCTQTLNLKEAVIIKSVDGLVLVVEKVEA